MSVRMVRAKIRPGKSAEVERVSKEMFAIEAAAPQGVRYASCDFQAAPQGWVDGSPVVGQLTPVGSYRLF